MIEPKQEKHQQKKPKKGFITEDNVSTLLHRYPATTVLALLQEVNQFPDAENDWDALAKRTSTGISNPRELQMLWRHLAYGDDLLGKVEDEARPLDDGSDLEFELEASPVAGSEALNEAAACVKVLMASGVPSDPRRSNSMTFEAPLTINIPNGQSSSAAPECSQASFLRQGRNITVQVSVPSLPTTTFDEGLDGHGPGGGNQPLKKKRKQWSKAEDNELIAAVEKCGEGNWPAILEGGFKLDRTPAQLAQRWLTIKKRQGNTNVSGPNTNGTQLSEAQLAARHAMSIALNMPVKNVGSGPSLKPVLTSSSIKHGRSSDMQMPGQSNQMSRPLQISPPKTTDSSDSMGLKAAAVAAGARIVAPSDAASFLRATQAKPAVHIVPKGGSLARCSNPGSSTAHPNLSVPSNGTSTLTQTSGLALQHTPAVPVATTLPRASQLPPQEAVKLDQRTGKANPSEVDSISQNGTNERQPVDPSASTGPNTAVGNRMNGDNPTSCNQGAAPEESQREKPAVSDNSAQPTGNGSGEAGLGVKINSSLQGVGVEANEKQEKVKVVG
ncbi:hypothetical protein MLD38_034820 [Melastoma candidum]|uniref:Uncharacterized protein n=1 Tax=Melastoma candidum TaxID=119954 RepID=A0ACB9MDC0_9MYRT|nr:hypothetical protein MLD38_034820 [Melastoma candidum]